MHALYTQLSLLLCKPGASLHANLLKTRDFVDYIDQGNARSQFPICQPNVMMETTAKQSNCDTYASSAGAIPEERTSAKAYDKAVA